MKKTKTELYRHYGHSKFDPKKFQPVYNRYLSNKPYGGLWACPTVDVDIDWKTWSENENFRTDKLKEYFDFKIKKDSRVLVIKDIKDIDKLPRIVSDDPNLKGVLVYDSMNLDIDFEKLKENYDAMLVYMYRSKDIPKELMCCDGIYYKLYGWDVDTLLVMNPDIIEEV